MWRYRVKGIQNGGCRNSPAEEEAEEEGGTTEQTVAEACLELATPMLDAERAMTELATESLDLAADITADPGPAASVLILRGLSFGAKWFTVGGAAGSGQAQELLYGGHLGADLLGPFGVRPFEA